MPDSRLPRPDSPAIASFEEIRRLIPDLPGPDLDAGSAAATREAKLTKPAGALGRLEALVAWLATWQARHPPRLDHPRVAVFAGNHGVAGRGVSAYPAQVTAQMVQNFIAGGAAVNQLCKAVDADLRVYEMTLDRPTRDFTQEPAMHEAECAQAMAYGMMAVEPGLDALALGEMGIANTTAAAAMCLALFGGTAADWTGPGTGVVGNALERKIAVVAEGVARHHDALDDPLEVLRRLGGHELAAITGAILAARLARTPAREPHYVWIQKLLDMDVLFATAAGRPPVASEAEAKSLARIGVREGSPMVKDLQDRGFANLVIVKSPDENARALVAGRIDAWYAPAPEIGFNWTTLKLPGAPVWGVKLDSAPLYVAASKNSPGIQPADWQRAFVKLKDDGTIERILGAYLPR